MADLSLANAFGTGAATDARLEWSELGGKTGKEAKALIEKDPRYTDVHYVPRDCGVFADYRSNRVRIYVDAKCIGDDEKAKVIYENAKVISVPRVG